MYGKIFKAEKLSEDDSKISEIYALKKINPFNEKEGVQLFFKI